MGTLHYEATGTSAGPMLARHVFDRYLEEVGAALADIDRMLVI
jgi:hypothetical protein